MKSPQNVVYSGESCENGMAVQKFEYLEAKCRFGSLNKKLNQSFLYVRRRNGLHVTEVQT